MAPQTIFESRKVSEKIPAVYKSKGRIKYPALALQSGRITNSL